MSRTPDPQYESLIPNLISGMEKRVGRPLSFGEKAAIRRVFRKHWRPDCDDQKFLKRIYNALRHIGSDLA